jgi:spermidine synthase
MSVQITSKDDARPEQTIIWEGKIKDILITDKTRIIFLTTPTFGDILFMDDSVQSSEYDYELYHRVLVNPIGHMFSNPKGSAIVLGGGEGCTTNQIISSSFAGNVTQIDHDRQALDWAAHALSDWNNNIYMDHEHVNVINDDAFDAARNSVKLPEQSAAKFIVIDLFDPDTSTLHGYCELLGSVANKWLNPNGGIVAYFGLWPNSTIKHAHIVNTLTPHLGNNWKIHGYTHYIPSFCSECLFLVVIPHNSEKPVLEEGSTWRF